MTSLTENESSLTQDTFTTSDGRQINLRPGWFEIKNVWPLALSFEDYANNIGKDDEYPIDNSFFLNKLMTADAMYCLLRDHGFTPCMADVIAFNSARKSREM